MGFNNFFDIAQKIKPACQVIISETVQEIAVLARSNAPRDTDYMADSVYYVDPLGGNTYGQSSPTRPEDYLLEEVEPPSDMAGVVGAAAYYSIFVEMGHHVHNSTTYVPPNPWFIPALEAGMAIFEDKMGELESLL